MQHALAPAGLPSQTHQGGGARFFGRFGRALRGTFAGIARLRRRAEPPPNPQPAAAQDPQTPGSPGQTPSRRRPVAAPQPQPTRPGWIARFFGLRERSAAAPRVPSFADDGGPDFTPENHPHLAPEVCAILNTPAQDLPPEVLRILLTVLAQEIAAQLPPELGLSDPQALFSGLWSLLAAPVDEAPDVAPAEPSDAAPAATEAVPEDAGMQTDPPPEAPASGLPDCAAATASQATPETIVPSQPGHRRRTHRHGRRQAVHPSRLRPSGLRNARQFRPPAWRVYDACAGPP